MDLFKSWLVESYIAHRGLHDEKSPENSLSAFQKAIDKGYPIETDVHQIADGTLVIFHDDSLQRMTGKDGYIKNLKKADLKKYQLGGSKETIPTLDEFLDLLNGQVPVLIEIKNVDKVGELESALYARLKKYKGEFAIQSFNPYSVGWFKQNAPEIIRGQLAGYFRGENLSFIKKLVLKRMLLNKVSCPNFIAYEGKTLTNHFVNRYKKLPLLAWTIRSQEEYMNVVGKCDNIIFENFEPKV